MRHQEIDHCRKYILNHKGLVFKKPQFFFANIFSCETVNVVFEPFEPKLLRMQSKNETNSDPYFNYLGELQGYYLVNLIPLVTPFFQDLYCLGWLVNQQCYVIWRKENNDFIALPGLTWDKILAHPDQIFYFDYFYQKGKSKLSPYWLKKWLTFPFVVPQLNLTIEPFSGVCAIHQKDSVVFPRQYFDEPLLMNQKECANTIWYKRNQEQELLIRRYITDYLLARNTHFPNSAVLNEQGTGYHLCITCENAKHQWLSKIKQTEQSFMVQVKKNSRVDCPHCRNHFDLDDTTNYRYGRHMACGQKLILNHE